MSSSEKHGHEQTANDEFHRVDRAVQIYNTTEVFLFLNKNKLYNLFSLIACSF